MLLRRSVSHTELADDVVGNTVNMMYCYLMLTCLL